MADLSMHQGDTPTYAYTLTNADGSNPDLTGGSVKFVMRSLLASSPVVNASATIVNAATGHVDYTFQAADSATAGGYMATWVATLASGAVVTYPTTGYLDVRVEQNLTTAGGQQLVSLSDAKAYLNIPAASRDQDSKIVQMIESATPMVEAITGPIVQRSYNEWYDGGNPFVVLRNRPVLALTSVTEYRGPIAYALTIITDPGHGTIYSCMLDEFGRVERRSAGGGIIAFPAMPQSVNVVYTAGLAAVPDNVRHGTLELLRINYQQTQQGGRPAFGSSVGGMEDQFEQMNILGFYMPRRVREMLSASRRFPSLG